MPEQRVQDAGSRSESHTAPWAHGGAALGTERGRTGCPLPTAWPRGPAAPLRWCPPRLSVSHLPGPGPSLAHSRCPAEWPCGPAVGGVAGLVVLSQPACRPVRHVVSCSCGAGVTGCLQQSLTPRFVLSTVPRLSEDLSPWPRCLCGDLQPGPRWRLWSHLLGAFRAGCYCGQSSSC